MILCCLIFWGGYDRVCGLGVLVAVRVIVVIGIVVAIFLMFWVVGVIWFLGRVRVGLGLVV